MASIISQRDTCDGHRVVIETAGRQHTLHFQVSPNETDRDAAVVQYEQRMVDDIANDIVVMTDDIDMDFVPDNETEGV